MASLGQALQGLPDLERGITRLLHRTASPSEFLTVLLALSSLAQRLKVQVWRLGVLLSAGLTPPAIAVPGCLALSAGRPDEFNNAACLVWATWS